MPKEISYFSREPGILIKHLFATDTYVSKSNRALLESRAHQGTIDRLKRLGISMARRPHRFSDSRSYYPDTPKNGEAMADILTQGDEFTNTLAWMNHHFFADDNTSGRTVNQLYDMAITVKWMPAYLVLRAEESIDPDQIPSSLGGLFKTALGVATATRILKESDLGEDIVTPLELYSFVNLRFPKPDGTKNRPLLAGKDEVCAASGSQIISTLEILMHGASGNWQKSELEKLIDPSEFEDIRNFGRISEKYEQLVKRHKDLLEIEQPDEEVARQIRRFARDELTLQKSWNESLGRDPDALT